MVDYRRWSRLSKIQTEVHTKLLDRFQSNQDLLAYIQTPAGRRFLESAPIPIESPRAIGAPLGRILWSAQAGAVADRARHRHRDRRGEHARRDRAAAHGASAPSTIALGIGFIVSALLAYVLTRRFGLLNGPTATTPEIPWLT